MYYGYGGWPRYVPVAERRKKAEKAAAKLVKRGKKIFPVKLKSRALAKTFWGKAWCHHLESFSDYANRLPRGRTYVRNGSVVHLEIEKGRIKALVQGTSLYKIEIAIKAVAKKRWQMILDACSGRIDSALELLQGKLSHAVMETITHRDQGLFPKPKEITLNCSCPDWAQMCKHVAAALYGVGARLDHEPELLFRLRQVDHLELINKKFKAEVAAPTKAKVIRDQNLSEIFGVEIDEIPQKDDIAPTAGSLKKPKLLKKSRVKKARKSKGRKSI